MQKTTTRKKMTIGSKELLQFVRLFAVFLPPKFVVNRSYFRGWPLHMHWYLRELRPMVIISQALIKLQLPLRTTWILMMKQMKKKKMSQFHIHWTCLTRLMLKRYRSSTRTLNSNTIKCCCTPNGEIKGDIRVALIMILWQLLTMPKWRSSNDT